VFGNHRGKPHERAAFSARLAGDEKYVRMECVDALGRRAYSNPIFLDGRERTPPAARQEGA
jgi:hypothetical protein